MVSEQLDVILCFFKGEVFHFPLASIRIFKFIFDFLHFENDMPKCRGFFVFVFVYFGSGSIYPPWCPLSFVEMWFGP